MKQVANQRIKLSIILVEYNTIDLLIDCLNSIKNQQIQYPYEVIVIDNDSHDGSVEEIKKFKTKEKHIPLIVHFNTQNVGFSVANNQGIRLSKGEYILLLNSDTILNSQVLNTMIQFFEHDAQVGAATCKILLPNGEMDPACHRGFPTPWAAITYFVGLEAMFPKSHVFGQYHQQYKLDDRVHEVDAISGAFFMVRRVVVDAVGLLDEDYFMYGEDLDWAYRMKQLGFHIFFNSTVSIMHRKNQSGRASSIVDVKRKTNSYFYTTMKLFYAKHYKNKYGLLMYWLVVLGIKLRSKI